MRGFLVCHQEAYFIIAASSLTGPPEGIITIAGAGNYDCADFYGHDFADNSDDDLADFETHLIVANSDGHVFAGSYGLYGIITEESYGYGIYNNLSQLDSTHPFGRMKIGLTFYHRLVFPDIYHCEEHLTP